MTYLTYAQYQANGGSAESSAFPILERLARAKLDYWTQGRVTAATRDVDLCMTILVNAMAEIKENQEGTPSSFSNDGISVSLAKTVRTESEIMNEAYDQIVEILPIDLVSVVI